MEEKYKWQEYLKIYSFDSKEDFLWCYVMGGCGCGSSEELGQRAWKVLENFSKEHAQRDFSIYDDLTNETIAHWFDKLELIKHGSSIGGSWLSEEGVALYETLKNYNIPHSLF